MHTLKRVIIFFTLVTFAAASVGCATYDQGHPPSMQMQSRNTGFQSTSQSSHSTIKKIAVGYAALIAISALIATPLLVYSSKR